MKMRDADQRLDEIVELFELNDNDGNGDIDFAEFAALSCGLDADLSHDALAIGFAEIDTNKDGRVDLAEFLNWWLDD
jgi:Ca2+-binding EF-hand superfamily protein